MTKVLDKEQPAWNQPIPDNALLTTVLIGRPEFFEQVNATAADRADAGHDEYWSQGDTFTREALYEAIDRKKESLTKPERIAATIGGGVLGVLVGLVVARANHAAYVHYLHHLAPGTTTDKGNYFVNVSGIIGFFGIAGGYGSAVLARDRLARHKAIREIDRLAQQATSLVIPGLFDTSTDFKPISVADSAPASGSIRFDRVDAAEALTSTRPLTTLPPIGEDGTLSKSWSFEPVGWPPPMTEIPPAVSIEDYKPAEIENVFATPW